jgi:type IV secretory pathway TrbL component
VKNVILGLLVVSAVLVGACSKKDAAGGAGATGVAECDEYLAKYPACIAKMPAAGKAAAEAGFKVQSDAWKAAAATPEGKAALKANCKATLDALASNPMCK